ncbi:MAG: hypothetical protein IT443_07235 [Phycisphaeraceae bacterium]|nr:hypothetical protein [Phycisphaeraceae bacterium]
MTCPTTEAWAAWLDGAVPSPGREELAQHAAHCPLCQATLQSLRQVDSSLARLRPQPVPADVLMRVRQSLSPAAGHTGWPQIMTLEEVGRFMQLDDRQLDEIVEDLPAFELAGQIRVRYARLLEWIAQREREFTHQRTGSWVGRPTIGRDASSYSLKFESA